MKLYKYREFASDLDKLAPIHESDQGVKNLFACEAWLSSRSKFNDPFDSHINFKKPTPQSLKRLLPQLTPNEVVEVESWIEPDGLSAKFHLLWENLKVQFNALIDRYSIYCFAAEPDNNIMWSHYAKNHTGYCIELNSKHFGPIFGPIKVKYRPKLYEIDAIELIKILFNIPSPNAGKLIQQGLNTKLYHWGIENEYRHIASGLLPTGSTGIAKPYPNQSVSAIIFGARIDAKKRSHIMNHLPYKAQFKQAHIDINNSKIVIKPLP